MASGPAAWGRALETERERVLGFRPGPFEGLPEALRGGGRRFVKSLMAGLSILVGIQMLEFCVFFIQPST